MWEGIIIDVVRTGGLEPPRAFARQIFVPATAFAADARLRRLGSGLSLHPIAKTHDLDAARLVSTPSPPTAKIGEAWLGIGLGHMTVSFPRI